MCLVHKANMMSLTKIFKMMYTGFNVILYISVSLITEKNKHTILKLNNKSL